MAKETLPTWPNGWDENLKERLKWLTPGEKIRMLEILKQDEEELNNNQEKREPNPELFWNEEAIIKDLKENYIKIEDDAEIMWKKWKIVHINLPKIWDFDWLNFKCFIWNDALWPDEYDEIYNKLNNQFYTNEELFNILSSFTKYLNTFWIKNKEETEIYNTGGYVTRYINRNIWKYLKDIFKVDDPNNWLYGTKTGKNHKWGISFKSNEVRFLYDSEYSQIIRDAFVNLLLKV